MNYQTIKKAQKEYGFYELQECINSGLAWKLEGSYGRAAMNALEVGLCMLPKQFHKDTYGNTVPSRDVLKKGTKGTFQNCSEFWQKVLDGEIYLSDYA